MKIHVAGAAGGEVTGSAYYVQTDRAAVLVDCGQFQGTRKSETLNRWLPPSRVKLDAVLITHAHLDHVGRLPILAQRGHRMPVYATEATIEMAALILRDSAHILAADAEHKNRKRARAGEAPVPPLYTPEDAEAAIDLLRPVPYQQPVEIAPGIQAIWAEAGHMLGSASIQLIVEEGGRRKKIVFSGDLGPKSAPILRTYEPFHEADVVFMESTYGSRDHRPFAQTVEEFVTIVRDAIASGGKMLVPTFAVGRAQLIAGLLGWMFRNQKARPFPIFLDSPMAIQALEIYAKHRELFDDAMKRYIEEKPLREDLRSLKATVTSDESRRINEQVGSCLIMAGAGMCNAGRILHHFKANLWKPETHVLIVGYQAVGTLGRLILNGTSPVRILGESLTVRAEIEQIAGFSAHADRDELLRWLGDAAARPPRRVFVVHGEPETAAHFAATLRERRLESAVPAYNDRVELT